jgi:multisubunit Na+/H+ antiporter MnhB subunit
MEKNMIDWKKILTNSWMNNADVLAQIGHSLAGYALMLTVAYFSNTSFLWLGIFASALTTYAAIKEFWYDANYEIPKQTNLDNITDFSFYCVGLVVGFGVAMIKLIK